MTRNGTVLLEEYFVQNTLISMLNPDTVNTIRVITMRDDSGEVNIPFANIRIGRKGMCVDNFCSGGMTAGINTENGVVITPAFDGKLSEYTQHPDTGTPILGFQIPFWESVLDTVIKAADRISGCRYVGWDVVINRDGKICLIEGNSNPEARIHQMVLHKGLRSVYREYLGEV